MTPDEHWPEDETELTQDQLRQMWDRAQPVEIEISRSLIVTSLPWVTAYSSGTPSDEDLGETLVGHEAETEAPWTQRSETSNPIPA